MAGSTQQLTEMTDTDMTDLLLEVATDREVI